MDNAPCNHQTRNDSPRLGRDARVNRNFIAHLLVVTATLFLTLSCWVRPVMANEQEEESRKPEDSSVASANATPAPSTPPSPRAAPPLTLSGSSSANTQGELSLGEPSSKRKFYGRKLILADAIADSLWVTGAMLGGICAFSGMDFSGNGGSGGSDLACGTATAFGAVGAGTFLIVPPIIHGAHRRPEAAFGSLGMRSSVIGLGAFLESAGEDSAFLVVNHLIGTRIIDWFVLAFEKPDTAPQQSSEVTLRPTFLLDKQNTEIGLRGQF